MRTDAQPAAETARPPIRYPEASGGAPYELRLVAGGLEMVGVSLTAAATAFALPDLGVALDMGRCTPLLAAQDTLLLSHCHSDHTAGLIAWLSARSRGDGLARSRILVPAARRESLLTALLAWPDLDRVRRRCDLAEVIVPAEVGTEVELGAGWRARAIPSHHTVPSVGWRVRDPSSPRSRLVFTGDSSLEPYRGQLEWLEAEVAVVDCSFIEPGHRFAARLSGHTHLAEWCEVLADLRCVELVLAHLPPDATRGRLRELLGRLPVGAPTVIPWLAP